VRQWQGVAGLIDGQLKQSYRRRKLVRVTHVMRLGTGAALKVALQELGRSGRLHTACIERVHLTVRQGGAVLARRAWAMAKPAPHLLAHLEWWRASSHCASPCSAPSGTRAATRTRGQATGAPLATAYPRHGSGNNEPTMDSAGSALFSLASGGTLHTLSVNEVRRRHVK